MRAICQQCSSSSIEQSSQVELSMFSAKDLLDEGTATEHATFDAAAPVDNDGVHLAKNFAQWQPPAPGTVRRKTRSIGEILACCTDDMGWMVVQDIAQNYPDSTLAEFEWRSFLQQLWESSIKEGIRISSAATEHTDWHHEMDVETWQKILFACELDTVEGLRKYVQAWCGEDRKHCCMHEEKHLPNVCDTLWQDVPVGSR